MHIAIIGASAGTGLLCVQQALARGHEVTTLSRHVESLPRHDQLHALRGDARKPGDTASAVAAADAVLVTLGTGRSLRATTLFSESATALLQALAGRDVPLIVLSGFGAGDSRAFQPAPVRVLFGLFLGRVYADKNAMERMLAAGYRQWEMVRPGVLTDGPATGRYRVLTRLQAGMHVGRIARADVAAFMVAQAEAPSCLGLYPVLTN